MRDAIFKGQDTCREAGIYWGAIVYCSRHGDSGASPGRGGFSGAAVRGRIASKGVGDTRVGFV